MKPKKQPKPAPMKPLHAWALYHPFVGLYDEVQRTPATWWDVNGYKSVKVVIVPLATWRALKRKAKR